MKNIFLFGTVVLLFVLVNCDRGSEFDPPDLADVLVQAPWTSTTTFQDWDLFGDYEEYGDSCKKDDTWYFSTDGTFERQYGAIACDSAYSANEIVGKGTWEIQKGNSILVMKTPTHGNNFEVYYYSETELELRQTDGFIHTPFRPLKLILQR